MDAKEDINMQADIESALEAYKKRKFRDKSIFKKSI